MKTLQAINPLEGVESYKKPERRKHVVQDTSGLEQTLNAYQKMLKFKEGNYYYETASKIAKMQVPVLQPAQINLFLQLLLRKDHPELDYERTGVFLTRLIQVSYNAGNNDFELRFENEELNRFAYELKGKEKRPLRLKVKGNLADNCAHTVSYCQIDVQGNVGDNFAELSTYSTFNIKGNAEMNSGQYTNNCKFTIGGDVDRNFMNSAENCSAAIKGDAGVDFGKSAKNCRFKIKGKASNYSGASTQNCYFDIGGNIGVKAADCAGSSTFIIKGKEIEDCWGDIHKLTDSGKKDDFAAMARNCVFKVKNKELYEMLKHVLIWHHNETNKITLLRK